MLDVWNFLSFTYGTPASAQVRNAVLLNICAIFILERIPHLGYVDIVYKTKIYQVWNTSKKPLYPA